MTTIELGLDTFGDVTLGADGAPKPMDQVLRDVVEQGVLADEVGVRGGLLGQARSRERPGLRGSDGLRGLTRCRSTVVRRGVGGGDGLIGGHDPHGGGAPA